MKVLFILMAFLSSVYGVAGDFSGTVESIEGNNYGYAKVTLKGDKRTFYTNDEWSTLPVLIAAKMHGVAVKVQFEEMDGNNFITVAELR